MSHVQTNNLLIFRKYIWFKSVLNDLRFESYVLIFEKKSRHEFPIFGVVIISNSSDWVINRIDNLKQLPTQGHYILEIWFHSELGYISFLEGSKKAF